MSRLARTPKPFFDSIGQTEPFATQKRTAGLLQPDTAVLVHCRLGSSKPSRLMHRSKPPLYSITSSARPSSESGGLIPSASALLRFKNNSTFVLNWTGRSAGFSPFKIRPA
jgi:hypothetical protein